MSLLIPVEIVVEFVVACHRDEGAPSSTHAVEQLLSRLCPRLAKTEK